MSPITGTVQHSRPRNPGKVDIGITDGGPPAVNGLYGWWPVSKQIGYNDNDLMGLLIDYSGNNRNGASSGNYRPTYKTNIVNGFPVARFSGNHYFNVGNHSLAQATWFLVWSRTNAGNNDAVLIVNGNDYSYLQYGSTWYWSYGGSTAVAMSAGSFKLKCAKYDNSNVTLYTNGSQDASPASTADCNFLYIGAGGFGLSGDIAEVILFNTNLSDTDRQYIENYVNTKYALW